jgi:hypothetical protein
MSIKARVKRLERFKIACGPDCPSQAVVYVGEDWYGRIGPPEDPGPCTRCGRPADVIRMVMDPDFYGTADRLREITT